jgi:hypothetical protein
VENCPLQLKRLKKVTTLQELNEYGTELQGMPYEKEGELGVRVSETSLDHEEENHVLHTVFVQRGRLAADHL